MVFNSLLVEGGYFEEATMGFLVVGHTHASIDQYFSCLRKRIRRAQFIASPLALHYLFSLRLQAGNSGKPRGKRKKESIYRPPLLQIQLSFVYDYVSAFAPYINKSLKKYGIPYQFKFSLFCGKCVWQYKLLSTSPRWLPTPPPCLIASFEGIFRARVTDILESSGLSSMEGQALFFYHVGMPDSMSSSQLIAGKATRETADAVHVVLPFLQEVHRASMIEQELRHKDEALGIFDVERYPTEPSNREHTLRLAQNSILSLNTNESGFTIILSIF